MIAHALLNLLNELVKKIRCETHLTQKRNNTFYLNTGVLVPSTNLHR